METETSQRDPAHERHAVPAASEWTGEVAGLTMPAKLAICAQECKWRAEEGMSTLLEVLRLTLQDMQQCLRLVLPLGSDRAFTVPPSEGSCSQGAVSPSVVFTKTGPQTPESCFAPLRLRDMLELLTVISRGPMAMITVPPSEGSWPRPLLPNPFSYGVTHSDLITCRFSP